MAEEELLLGLVSRARMRKETFLRSYEKAAKVLARNLDRFLDDPDERAVHDARTAIRRVDAHVNLLPKAIRRRPTASTMLERHRAAMKRTAKVRDLDIVRGKVSRAGEAATGLLPGIERLRNEAAGRARGAIASSREAATPVPPKDLSGERLQRRFRKVTGRLASRVEGLLPVVAGDADRLEELHELRIACKKLRYTLEPSKGDSAEALSLMEGWQDDLGAIRDWDVTISYLRRSRQPAAKALLRRGAAERATQFRAFAASVLEPTPSASKALSTP